MRGQRTQGRQGGQGRQGRQNINKNACPASPAPSSSPFFGFNYQYLRKKDEGTIIIRKC